MAAEPAPADERDVIADLARQLGATHEDLSLLDPRSGRLLNLIPAAIGVCDVDGRWRFLNRKASALVEGLSPGGTMPNPGEDGGVLPILPAVTAAISDGRSRSGIQVLLRRADGAMIDVSVEIELLRGEGGDPDGAVCVFQDVTERTRAQRHLTFLHLLSHQLALAVSEDELVRCSTRALGQHLSANRCFVFEREGGGTQVKDDWRPADLPAVTEIISAAEFPGMAAREAAGDEPFAVADTASDPRTQAAYPQLARLRIRALASFGCSRAGGRQLVIGVARGQPQTWASDELELLEQVGARLWTSLERIRVEDNLRRSDARFRALVSAIPAIVWSARPNGDVDFVSEQWFDYCGRTTGSAGIPSVVHPEDEPRRATAWNEAVRTGRDYVNEVRLRRHDGQYRWFLTRATPARDPLGNVIGWFGSSTDIHDLKHAGDALRESEERLRQATQTGKVGVWDWDIGSNRVTWTDSLYEIHGVSRADFGGTVEAFAALVHPDDRGPVARAIQSSLEHGAPYELEFRLQRPSGGLGWVYTHATVVRENGRPVRMLGATFDITARKQAETALRESEGRFRALTSHAPVGIFLSDTAGDALYVNETWRAMGGIEAGQARGRGWLQAVHPDDRVRVEREWYTCVQERRNFSAEYRFQRPTGEVTWLQGRAVEFRNAAGAFVGYIGTVADITQRKSAEDALRESEKRFRTLASHAPVGIFVTDSAGDTVFVNESWMTMSGLTFEKARGRGWTEAIHPEDRTRVVDEWARAIAENRASAAEYRFVHPDGTVTWVQGNAVELRDDTGRPNGYIGTIADLTHRKAAEEGLRAREAQLRLVTENAPTILAHCDRSGRFLFVNRGYAERFGRRAEDIIGRPLQDIIGAEAHATLWPHIERVLGGESLTLEIEVPYRDLGVRFMRMAYTPDVREDGSVRGWLCAISDITDRRQMEQALRESETRFRQLADSMPQIVFAADARGVFDYFNRRWYELAGSEAAPAGDASLLPMLHPDDRPRCLDSWYGSVGTGRMFQIEFRILVGDDYRWHLGRALPMRDVTGGIVRWFGTCTDIHDWKLVQEKLRTAQRQLQAHASELEQVVAQRTASLREAIVQMEEFSYSVSHDLRAPLRAMNAYAEALAEDYGPQLDATARDYLARIRRSSVRMEKLTHDVLTFSRVARTEVDLVELDLEQLLRDLISQYSDLHAPAAEVVIATPLHRVRAHESSLGQSLANLLTNAAKFVEPGVRPRIQVRTELVGEHVRLWIEDNGIGIAPEFQRRLFRVFERAPTRHVYEGTGIGLAIVRKAVEKMGGRCGVESDGRTGSRFWIELVKS